MYHTCYVDYNNPDNSYERKLVTVGEKKNKYGKTEKIIYAKSKLTEGGLPDHVVKLYITCTHERVKARMTSFITGEPHEQKPVNQMKYVFKRASNQAR